MPISPKPYCVGEKSFFYRFTDAVPSEDLRLSYPSRPPTTKRLETAKDLAAWFKTLGGPQVALNCALLGRLREESSAAVRVLLEGRACRKTCRGG